MKKIFSQLFISLLATSQLLSPALAQASPMINFNVDCNTANKLLNIGVTTDPTTPSNGKEVIAFQFTFELKAIGTTTKDDLKNATITPNPALTNMVIAENTKKEVGALYRIRVAGGFTGQNGIKNDNLFVLKNTNQKAFEISVTSAELYAQSSINNFYPATPIQRLNINPKKDCAPKTTPAANNSPPSGTTTNGSSTPANSQNPTSTQSTAKTKISISSSATNNTAKPGDSVIVSAQIKNRNKQAISWVQKSGPQISPTTKDTDQGANDTLSKLLFTVPQGITKRETISLVLTVGKGTDKISEPYNLTIEPALKGAAATQTRPLDQTQSKAIQERITARRTEIQKNAIPASIPSSPAEAGNIHSASQLPQSGPGHILILFLISGIILLSLKKLKKKIA